MSQPLIAVTSGEPAGIGPELCLKLADWSGAGHPVVLGDRDLLAARQQLVQARRALLSSQVGLYAALGGGSGAEPAALPATLPATPADPPNS